MTPALKILYLGGAALALIAVLVGSYDYFVTAREGASFIADVLVPLGAFVVISILYRRRKAGLEGDSGMR